jgi:hypothetical protein
VTTQPIHCAFFVRTPAGDAQYRYRGVMVPGFGGAGRLDTCWPPAVGDLISLRDFRQERQDVPFGHVYRVIERHWVHPQYGTRDWPSDQPAPDEGPMLDIIVEITNGPFRNEIDRGEREMF